MKSLKAGILVLAAIAFSAAVGNASNGPTTTKPPVMEQKATCVADVITSHNIVVIEAINFSYVAPVAEPASLVYGFYLDFVALSAPIGKKVKFTPQQLYRRHARPPSTIKNRYCNHVTCLLRNCNNKIPG